MFLSFKTIIKLHRLLQQDNITQKIVGILALHKPDLTGDISKNRANLKNFLVKTLDSQNGCMKLNDEVYILLVDGFNMLNVSLSINIKHRFYHIVEDETLEIIEEIYNRVIINLDDELKLQNFFRNKKFHSDPQTGVEIHTKELKSLEEQLVQANDYISELIRENVILSKEFNEKQGKMILQLKETKRKLKEEYMKNKMHFAIHNPQEQPPIDAARELDRNCITSRNRVSTPTKSTIKLPILLSLAPSPKLHSRHVKFG